MSDEGNGNGNGLPPDELQALRDRAVKPAGFRVWLTRGPNGDGVCDPRFEPLRSRMINPATRLPDPKIFPARYDRETWAKGFDYDPDLLELLTIAEMEWRVDTVARSNLDRKLEVDTTSALDFRDPTQHQAQFCRFLVGHGNPSGRTKGRFCKDPAVPGTLRCKNHGGDLVDVVTRRAVLMSSFLQIVEATDVAVNALLDVTLNSRNDLARVQAAKEILDRAGLTAELNVTIKLEGDDRSEKMDKLREKLDSMQRGLMHQVSIDTTSA